LVFALESASVAEVVDGLAGLAALRDISIVEPDIEEVVARLYRAPAEIG
jgi:ABC-2 type transport system ATP-binding protein